MKLFSVDIAYKDGLILLVICDNLSRFTRVVPIKTKSPIEIPFDFSQGDWKKLLAGNESFVPRLSVLLAVGNWAAKEEKTMVPQECN